MEMTTEKGKEKDGDEEGLSCDRGDAAVCG